LIYLSGCNIVIPGYGHVKVPLVISEIEVNFTTIIQNVDFAYECMFQSAAPQANLGPRSPCSVGLMVPASTFMYGSILIAVTFNPDIFKRRPVEEAICESFKHGFKKSVL
jgi:hypothetical protein